MTDAFPVFIGVTGKRALAESGDNQEQQTRKRLAAAFDYIESRLPDTRKVLLTGAALGADLVAAEEVLRIKDGKPRRNWLVLAALPFVEEWFKEDFEDPEWARYRRVVADPRTRRWVLPRLAVASPPPDSSLSRCGDPPDDLKELRRWHYEQVGLWIADTANVLIAVMPRGETTDKIGGTARIVACRRGGRPDATAAQIIAASTELAPRPALYRPPEGYVWLIDPTPARDPASPELPSLDPPVVVLPPAAHEDERKGAYRSPGELTFNTGTHDVGHADEQPDQETLLRRSTALLRVAEHYARDSRGRSADSSQPAAWPHASDPADELETVSKGLRDRGYKATNKSRHTFYSLVTLFLLAVLAFEVYAKFLSSNSYFLLPYLVLLCAIIRLYYVARREEVQPIAEDRRAVREVLRVQHAWWRAGLTDRVDFTHLKGADSDLSRVREAARNVIIWAQRSCPDCEPAEQWKAVFDPTDRPPFSEDMPASQHPKDWIGNQYYYFRQRETQRESKSQLIDAVSWALFVTSAWLAALLFVFSWIHAVHDLADRFVDAVKTLPLPIIGLMILACVGVACVWWWIRGRTRHIQVEVQRIALSIGLGLLAAVTLGFAILLTAALAEADRSGWGLLLLALPILVYAGYWLRHVLPDTNATQLTATVLGVGTAILLVLAVQAGAAMYGKSDIQSSIKYMAIILVVFLPALAGAMRFISEKLAVEAEALSYRDACGWFEHADELLKQLRPGNGDANADKQAQAIVTDLGKLALQESESWLKSRRERPLSPVIGG
jgi:hypothetical protein